MAGKLITQLSIFINNEPGSLASMARVLKDCNISLRAFNIAESEGFGVLRAVAEDNEAAYGLLKEAGLVVKKTDIIAVRLEDRPGGLHKVVDVLGRADLNIEYCYAYALSGGGPVVFLRVDDPERAVSAFEGAGMKVLSGEDI